MAKSPRAALTRLATSVAARYYPASGANPGFYLDGRMPGRRDRDSVDITLDREDRGFFYSVYASLSGGQSAETGNARVRKALDRVQADVRQPGRNIDNEINDLAECAVHVAGRITLQHEGVLQPYFAGLVVRDSELAAVTMGNACAYLYRGDVLYPLTSDDFPLEAVDMQGRPVSGMDVYCAGIAGTVRYSNIAQLQLDDCVIICNKEIMDALGQRDVLRLLYEAEDQADAAGLIVDEAASRLPGVPMQFMIGFVESIMSADRTGRFGTGRSTSEMMTGFHRTVATHAAAPASKKASAAAAAAPAAVAAAADPGDLATSPHGDPVPVLEDDAYDEYDEAAYDGYAAEGRGRRIAFYLIIAAVCIGSLFAIYNMLFGGDDEPQTTTITTLATTEGAGVTTAPSQTGPSTSESESSQEPSGSSTDESSDTTSDTTPPETTVPTSETTTAEPTTSETTTTTTTTPTTVTSPVTLPTTYTVQSGESLWAIANRFYPGRDVELMVDAILDANDIIDPEMIFPGEPLTIPAVP